MHRLPIARALAVATALACASAPAAGQVAPMSCGASAAETRWLAESYSETHTYGLGDEEWIGSYGGLDAAGDSLFLYDQLRPRIFHLSGELEERHAFGRRGEGPGEFDSPIPIVWLDDSGSSTCRRCRRIRLPFRSGRYRPSESSPPTTR